MRAHRPPYNNQRLLAGDIVVRRLKTLRTRGTVLRYDGIDKHGGVRVWVKWDHATTLPNPSLEPIDELERVDRDRFPLSLSGRGD